MMRRDDSKTRIDLWTSADSSKSLFRSVFVTRVDELRPEGASRAGGTEISSRSLRQFPPTLFLDEIALCGLDDIVFTKLPTRAVAGDVDAEEDLDLALRDLFQVRLRDIRLAAASKFWALTKRPEYVITVATLLSTVLLTGQALVRMLHEVRVGKVSAETKEEFRYRSFAPRYYDDIEATEL